MRDLARPHFRRIVVSTSVTENPEPRRLLSAFSSLLRLLFHAWTTTTGNSAQCPSTKRPHRAFIMTMAAGHSPQTTVTKDPPKAWMIMTKAGGTGGTTDASGVCCGRWTSISSLSSPCYTSFPSCKPYFPLFVFAGASLGYRPFLRYRSNIGNAKVAGLATDLNLLGCDYYIAAAVSFLLYAAAEIPRSANALSITPEKTLTGITICT